MGIHQALLSAGSSGIVPALPGGTASGVLGVSNATIVVKTDGTLDLSPSTTQSWFTPTTESIGTNYWVRIEKQSGDILTITPGSGWLQLSSNRTYGYYSVVGYSGVFLLKIATDSGGTNVVSSGTYTIAVS